MVGDFTQFFASWLGEQIFYSDSSQDFNGSSKPKRLNSDSVDLENFKLLIEKPVDFYSL